MVAFFRVRVVDMRQAACTTEGTTVPDAGGRALEGDRAWGKMACGVPAHAHCAHASAESAIPRVCLCGISVRSPNTPCSGSGCAVGTNQGAPRK